MVIEGVKDTTRTASFSRGIGSLFFLGILCVFITHGGVIFAVALGIILLWLLFLPNPKGVTKLEETQIADTHDTENVISSCSDDPGPIYGPGDIGPTGVHTHYSAWPD